MHALYLLIKFLPYWAVPTALVLGEIGRVARRKRSWHQITFFGLAAVLLTLTVLYFVYRWDRQAERWISELVYS